jgi:hypothetical protein
MNLLAIHQALLAALNLKARNLEAGCFDEAPALTFTCPQALRQHLEPRLQTEPYVGWLCFMDQLYLLDQRLNPWPEDQGPLLSGELYFAASKTSLAIRQAHEGWRVCTTTRAAPEPQDADFPPLIQTTTVYRKDGREHPNPGMVYEVEWQLNPKADPPCYQPLRSRFVGFGPEGDSHA